MGNRLHEVVYKYKGNYISVLNYDIMVEGYSDVELIFLK